MAAPLALKTLSRAKWLVPLVMTGARWVSAHPEVGETIREQAAQLVAAAKSRRGGVLTTIEVLRGQVDLLARSADDAAEKQQAKAWSRSLDGCEGAARLLQAPGATKEDRRRLTKRVEALRAEIFAAYIEEVGEDAEAAEQGRPTS